MFTEKYVGLPPEEVMGLFASGAIAGGLAVRAYFRSLLRDRGHTILVPPETHSRAFMDIAAEHGLKPKRKIVQGSEETPTTVQSLMSDNRTVFLAPDGGSMSRWGGLARA